MQSGGKSCGGTERRCKGGKTREPFPTPVGKNLKKGNTIKKNQLTSKGEEKQAGCRYSSGRLRRPRGGKGVQRGIETRKLKHGKKKKRGRGKEIVKRPGAVSGPNGVLSGELGGWRGDQQMRLAA